MDPVLTTTLTYNKIAQIYSDRYFDYYKNDLVHLKRFLRKIPDKGEILDAGSGPGGISHFLNLKRYKVVGVDSSSEMVRIATDRIPQALFQEMDIRELVFPEGAFDGVVCSYSLVHIPQKDVLKTLKGFNRVLKTKGVLFLAVHAGEGEKFEEERFAPGERIFVNLFSKEVLKKDLEEAGFEVIYEVVSKAEVDEKFIQNEIFIVAQKK